MAIHDIKAKLSKVTSELLRATLTKEDKGQLVLAKEKLNKALSKEEQAAAKALSNIYTENINEAKSNFKEAKIKASDYSAALQKELAAAKKGFEAIENINKLIDQNHQSMTAIKFSEDNKAYPKTSQVTPLLQHQHIKNSIVSDFFKALNVSFKNIDHHKGYFVATGAKRNNIDLLIKQLSEMKLNNTDVEAWYMAHHKKESNISQDVQKIISEV